MPNSIDPDETAHYEPSHLDQCCLQKPIIIACGSERIKPFEKWLYSKREELALKGIKIYPFKFEPWSKGAKINFDRVVSPESVYVPYYICFYQYCPNF